MGNSLLCGGHQAEPDEVVLPSEPALPRSHFNSPAGRSTERSLFLASVGTSPDVLKLLMTSADFYDDNRTSLLHIAARYSNIEVIEELLKQECSYNATDCAGWTCLHVASSCQRADIVKLMLKYGADPTARNSAGQTPCDLAKDPDTEGVFSENCLGTSPLQKWRGLGDIEAVKPPQDLKELVVGIANWDAVKGLSYAALFGYVGQTAQELASFLFENRVNPVEVGKVLESSGELTRKVAAAYLNEIGFSGLGLLAALRKLCVYVTLPEDCRGIVEEFAELYWDDRTPFLSRDSVKGLVNEVAALDYSCSRENEFVEKCRGIHGGDNFPRNYLVWIFQQVKMNPLRTRTGEEPASGRYNAIVAGRLKFRAKLRKRTKYFVLGLGVLWGFQSKKECVPWGCIPLSGVQITFEPGFLVFTMTGVIIYKVNAEGQVKAVSPESIVFRAKTSQWREGFSRLTLTRVLLKSP